MEITYKLIEPLIENSQVDGSTIYCQFRTPNGRIIESSARLRQSNSVTGKMQRKATRLVTNRARRSASRLTRSMLGGGLLGRLGSQLIRDAGSNENLGIQKYSSEDKRIATLAAFQKVEEYFDFDRSSNNWKAPVTLSNKPKDRLSLFEKQVKKTPVETHYDKEILARMLVELANADNNISKEEKEFLASLIGPEIGHLDDLLKKDPISQIECEEVDDKVKKTIYMMAWVMALIDLDLDPNEKEILMEYADMFDFSEDDKNELIRNAQFYMVENSINVSISRSDLYDLADKLELSHDDAERCLIDIKKRM